MNTRSTRSLTLRFARRLGRAGLVVLVMIAGIGLAMCSQDRPRWREGVHKPPATVPAAVPEPRLVAQSGGRVAWYQGGKHDLIVYDAVSDDKRKDTELYVMNPDGSGRRCITCGSSIPKGFVGNPDWHPDGDHIIIQVENKSSGHRLYNHMSWGFDNDLWLIRKDGTGARKIWATPAGYAALHSHFNQDGTMLVFAERAPTGKVIPAFRALTPGGENPWIGWRIQLAKVDVKAADANILSNHRILTPNGEGFYETHGFTQEGHLIYSHTAAGHGYVDDIFIANLDGSGVKNLTNSPSTWDEHGLFSSRGDFSFISSRSDPSLQFPKSRAPELRTELFVQKKGGPPVQVTDMNARKGKRIAVSDYDWDRDGKRIVFQVAVLDGSVNPEIWMIDIK